MRWLEDLTGEGGLDLASSRIRYYMICIIIKEDLDKIDSHFSGGMRKNWIIKEPTTKEKLRT